MKNIFDVIPPWIAAVLTVWIGIGIFYAFHYYNHPVQPVAAPIQTASSSPDTFSKKEECSNLQTAAQQEVNRYNLSQQPQYSSGGVTFGPGTYLNHEEFYQLFYSSKLNTCIKVIISQSLLKTDTGYTTYEEGYNLYDAFSDQYIDYVDTVKHGAPFDGLDVLDKKLDEYR